MFVKFITRIKFKKFIKLTILFFLLYFLFFIISNKLIFAQEHEDRVFIENKINEFRNQIREKHGQVEEILIKVNSVKEEIKLFKNKIYELNKEKNFLINQIKEKEKEIIKMTKIFNKNKENVYNLARQAYEDGEINYINIIFESETLTEFINNREYYLIIKNIELSKINKIKKERENISKEINELKKNKKNLDEKEKELKKQKYFLDLDIRKLNSSKDIIQGAEQLLLEELRKEQESLASIDRIVNASIESSGDFTYVGDGVFLWPVTHGIISSGYGYREMFGQYEFHPGFDIAANYGTPIMAVESGVTIISGDIGDGFGNKVVINHGSGLWTLYGHMSHVVVSRGEHVYRGQVIGYIGSTGFSTGPHLHLQITNCGDFSSGHVNPMNYFSFH